MRSLPLAAFALAALPSVHAQTAFVSGSPVILSALPSATAALYNNTNAPSAPTGKVFKYFMQIWLVLEDYETIVQLPQFQAVAEQGILLTNYNAISHPSQPNYIAAVAGSNFGITNNDYYDIPASETSVFDLLEQKGLTWKAYIEEIPAAGWTGNNNANSTYVRKHNPAIVFDSIGLNQTRSGNVVPADVLQVDIANNNIPAYSYYLPNVNNDANSTSAGPWLDGFLQSTLANAAFMNEALVVISFDESQNRAVRNQVWSCLIGGVIPASLRNTTDNTFYTHYSALHTVELNWGLGSLNRNDADTTLANVFQFAASALNYTNVDVSNVPLMNGPITGLLTDQSYNATHGGGGGSGGSDSSGAVGTTNVAHLFAAAALNAVAAVGVPYLF
ncbi:phosphoesterase family-domain-containing protein [Amanita rubescens]|nr:phosphoesterase family-domain-containing protein [Amanita rubescens]KAF8331556.1 phosphoesterase family-domain-containing protein [Amanita rubescens]